MTLVQNHLQNAAHFVGVAYPPNRFPCKSVHSCKHDSHFCMKICLALNSYISFIFMTLVRLNNHYPEILLFPAVKTPAHCLLLLATPQGTCLTRLKTLPCSNYKYPFCHVTMPGSSGFLPRPSFPQ